MTRYSSDRISRYDHSRIPCSSSTARMVSITIRSSWKTRSPSFPIKPLRSTSRRAYASRCAFEFARLAGRRNANTPPLLLEFRSSEPAFVLFHDAVRNRQSKTHASLLRAEERHEDERSVLGGDPGAGVGNHQFEVSVRAVGCHFQSAARRHRLDAVLDDIVDGAREMNGIHIDIGDARIPVGSYLNASRGQFFLKPFQHVSHMWLNIGLVKNQARVLRKIKQGFHDVIDPAHFFLHNIRKGCSEIFRIVFFGAGVARRYSRPPSGS